MLLYVSVIGLLLVIATIIRLKVSFFRKAFIPASLIAGFIGLALGPYALNIIPQTIVGSMGTLPGQLICIVFATMFLGYSHGEKLDKGTVHDSAAMLIWTWMGGCLQFAIPCLVYVYLAAAQPSSLWIITGCIFLDQFGYGFGFTAYMLYLIWFSEGEFKTSHYSLCTAFMALSMMIPGFFAGWIQEALGYTGFFILVMACSVLSIGITALAARKVDGGA